MKFVPALRLRGLTPLYDPVMRWLMPEERFRDELLAALGLGAGMQLLDVGCGTGTFATLVAERSPGVVIAALDADAGILDRARSKPGGDRVAWVRGDATRLPFDDATFDRVATTLVLHHLTSAQKVAAVRECRRVLRPGGALCIVDWDAPRGWRRATFWGVRLIDGIERTTDHARGRIAARAREAGFDVVHTVTECATAFGILRVTRCVADA